MLEANQDVTPESSTGTEPTGVDPSAGTQNTGTAPPPGQWIPYERFKEVNDRGRYDAARAAAAEARIAAFEQQSQGTNTRLQQLEAALQQRAQQTSRTPEEEQQRQLAIRALDELVPGHQHIKHLPNITKAMPAVAQGILGMQKELAAMQERQTMTFLRGEDSRLDGFGRQLGLTSTQDLQAYRDFVAGIVRGNPEAQQALLAGDGRVTEWAANQAKAHYLARGAASNGALADAKTLTQRLPPRSGGAAPGLAARMPAWDQNDPIKSEREFWSRGPARRPA